MFHHPIAAALVLLAFSLSSFAAHRVSAATRVNIVIDEPAEGRSVAWPLTTGIPFPRGQLRSERHCRLLDDTGTEQPLQSRVAATWDARKNSIRWLTIDFVAQPGRRYMLEFGEAVRRHEFETPLEVRRTGTVRVDTGALVTEFHAAGHSAIGSIRADLDGDGRIEEGEVVLSGPPSGDQWYETAAGEQGSSSRDGDDRRIVVESSGPVRACVCVDGFYTHSDGRRLVGYRTRCHFFAGLGLVKVVHEFRIIGSTKGTAFRDIGFSLELPSGVEGRQVLIDASGAPGGQVVAVPWRQGTRAVSSIQSIYRHFGNQKCQGEVVETTLAEERVLRRSDRVGEWLQVVDDRAAVTGSLRWLWQQFPKQWEVAPSLLTLHLWSPRGGDLDFGAEGLRTFFGEAGRKSILEWDGAGGTPNPISNFFYFAGHAALNRGDADGLGINKHHEFWLHVAPAGQAEAGRECGQLAARPPLALASGQWNCATDVFGPLAARPSSSAYEPIVDRLFDLGRDVQHSFGDYGWWVFGSGPHYSYQWDEEHKRHYADPRRFEYHTYLKETQLWWSYFRSGERKFLDWALPSESHWVDIAVTHAPLKYESAWRGGVRRQQTLWMRPGDWSIDSAMHYVRQRDSAEAWLRGGSQYWASYHRTLETTALAYYLTGDERFNDVLKFWRAYWADLAGKTGASPDVQPWHREQPWFVPASRGEPVKTWAEMIRDYAPFTSGMRHQMTQLFNLATLYEHTWDPVIGQALRECGDAYLDPSHRMGVWRTQENGPPNYADAPKMCHYWAPALWKYERVTRDPRMNKILRGYFDACYAADPFEQNIGQYSQAHLAYAYYYTRDPRHLRPAQIELDRLLPAAEPLKDPRDLGRRLYNPYSPIRALAAVPRLQWAIDQAARDGVAVPAPAPLRPQRTAVALTKRANTPLRATLWGYEPRLKIIGPDGDPFDDFHVATRQCSSDIQPFDRNLRNFEVYLHDLTIAANASPGHYVLAPRLELAVLSVDRAGGPVMANAAAPLALEPGEGCRLPTRHDDQRLKITSADAASVQLTGDAGAPLRSVRNDNVVVAEIPLPIPGKAGSLRSVRISNVGRRRLWIQIVDMPPQDCWVTLEAEAPSSAPSSAPSGRQTAAALLAVRPQLQPQPEKSGQSFEPGRFGKAVRIVPNRGLRIPDHVVVGGKAVRCFDLQQGTVEFWVKRQWDDRITPTLPVTFLSNGLIKAWSPWKLPLDEWAHVAVEWRPLKRDSSRQAVHIYVNGHDQQNYRSTWWEGYSQKPRTFGMAGPWQQQFLCRTQPRAPFLIDELRVSNVARHADLNVELGGQQVFNPSRFTPPSERPAWDDHTLLLLRFDGDLSGVAGPRASKITATFEE